MIATMIAVDGPAASGKSTLAQNLASALGVSRQSVNELLRERRAVSPEMAIRLARLFGNSAEFWMNLQRSVDLWDAGAAIKDDVLHIKPLCVA